MELQARTGRVQLQIESRGFNGLLFIAGQLGEAAGKGIGDAELIHLIRGNRN